MTVSLMIQGTASDVGKSVLVAGFCRIFSQDGYHCAPFKSQNMALNSGITRDGKEMGRAQIFQAQAAGIEPDVRMNPVLLKPTSDRKSQVVLMGKVANNMDAVEYHNYKPQLRTLIHEVYNSLAAEHDIIVLEGAGSPAEINLRDGDIVNMGMAEMIDAPVILVADIDRGGVFASIYGTLALLSDQERARVIGVIINKFRGDVALLMPGITQIEGLTHVPVLGVLPWLDVDLEDEDGVALQVGKYDGKTEKVLDIVVVQLPHIANFTDFNALATQPDVRLRYESDPKALGKPDLLIIPGSKNTLGDLLWLRQKGMDKAILAQHAKGTPVAGICGGYQILGKHIYDDVESGMSDLPGLGLLDITTRFSPEKNTTQTAGTISSTLPGIWSACTTQPVSGYEIHMGVSELGPDALAFAHMHQKNSEPCNHADGAVSPDGSVMGSYLHGIFDRNNFTRPLLNKLRESKGLEPLPESIFDYALHKEEQFNILAAQMREHLDIAEITRLMRAHKEKNSMIIITGGARSGKSSFAENLVAQRCHSALYIATSVITDDEMAARVARHKADRPQHWRTWEGFKDIANAIRYERKPGEGIMLECITTLIANLLYDASGGADPDTLDYAKLEIGINSEIDHIIDACKESECPVYIVTNELGMSITPENRLARHFVDIAGRINQKLARQAEQVWLVVSGIGVQIK